MLLLTDPTGFTTHPTRKKFLAQETSTGSLALRAQVQPDIVCPKRECANHITILSSSQTQETSIGFQGLPKIITSPNNHNQPPQS